ncbi:MAG: 3-oxoadipyl-CoA thiolase [Proteobacteria bacterium]|nr:3-oxoadipyl-CoA thiolase [Pseudomonadota bacterium]MBU1388851.1 3-oxoadipyl-CoA thiolase [Pseudomonadota bacterium]MBU1542232.1 3-oxoadipyl-CoA thiolase [Pseudomonadota bacterium]MBU2481545.1 3-oxoadipyl-CoA thiolase [Pseudomonadota bacterium]
MTDAYIYDVGRTAFGRHGGVLSGLRPDDVMAHLIRTIVERNPFDKKIYEDVIIGNTNQAGEDCRNVARFSGLLAGLPIETSGITVNRLCGSSLAAVLDAVRCVKCDEGDLFIAGGVESMSRAPLIVSKALTAFSRNQTIADSTMGARFTNPKIEAQFGADSMPQTADNIASDLGITREDTDLFALASQTKYEAARKDGYFKDEIIPIEVPQGRKKPPILLDADEHPRPGTTIEDLRKLKSLFPGGVVTAGNASGINDGASVLIIGNKKAGEKAGIKPRARILAGAAAGVPPRVMGLGPVPSSQKALARAGLALKDMDVIELNEAFATQALGCMKQLGLATDDPRINPNGGAVAVGHPLGASGGRIVMTALRQLERTSGRYALATMCIGIGQGVAAVIERL